MLPVRRLQEVWRLSIRYEKVQNVGTELPEKQPVNRPRQGLPEKLYATVGGILRHRTLHRARLGAGSVYCIISSSIQLKDTFVYL